MAQFDVHIPDSFVARLVVPVDRRIETIGFNEMVLNKILPYLGVPDIASLTAKQKAEVVCMYHLWELEVQNHSSTDANDARTAAALDSFNSFNPGT